jgi:hypothetical protein
VGEGASPKGAKELPFGPALGRMSKNFSFAAPRLCGRPLLHPTADAVGCILALLCG